MEFTQPTPAEQQVVQLQRELAAAKQKAQRSELAARAALQRAEFAESERDGLIDTLENAFGQICSFKHENGMSDSDDITGRWFKRLLKTLRESEINNSRLHQTNDGGGGSFMGSALDDVDMLNTSFYSGTALSRSMVEQASNDANYGNIDPLPLSHAIYSRNTSNNNTQTKPRRTKAKRKTERKKSNDIPKVYFCEICNKTFAGASGLWYHNKHVHGAETQLRPRKNKKNLDAPSDSDEIF